MISGLSIIHPNSLEYKNIMSPFVEYLPPGRIQLKNSLEVLARTKDIRPLA